MEAKKYPFLRYGLAFILLSKGEVVQVSQDSTNDVFPGMWERMGDGYL